MEGALNDWRAVSKRCGLDSLVSFGRKADWCKKILQLQKYPDWYGRGLKVMLHGTIPDNDFQRNIALQCWNNVVTIQNHVATMLQHCVALKLVVANRLV